jgi:CO/xanthine dehydrogenase FAD-binding subunit
LSLPYKKWLVITVRPFDYLRADDLAVALAEAEVDSSAAYLAGGTTQLDGGTRS